MVYVGGALSYEAGRDAFTSRGAPQAILLCAAAWLTSLHAFRRRRIARRHFTSMMLLTKVGTIAPRHPNDVESSIIELNDIS
jgi:hypothetical protein